MMSGCDDSEAGKDLVVIDSFYGCQIYQESSGQLLVAVDQRPQEFWVTDSLQGAHSLCRRLQAFR
jgi:hypothetical protein